MPEMPQQVASPSLFPEALPVVSEHKVEPAPKPSWSREACECWIYSYGGTAPGGNIGKHLKPLVKKYGWERIKPAWEIYVGSRDPRFSSPCEFATKLFGLIADTSTWKYYPLEPHYRAPQRLYHGGYSNER